MDIKQITDEAGKFSVRNSLIAIAPKGFSYNETLLLTHLL